MTPQPARTEQTLVTIFSWGFRLVLALLLTGLALSAVRDEPLTRHVEPISSVPAGLRHLRGAALIDLSFVILLATPAAGVLSILIRLLRQGRHPLALATAVVLATLGVGIVLAFR